MSDSESPVSKRRRRRASCPFVLTEAVECGDDDGEQGQEQEQKQGELLEVQEEEEEEVVSQCTPSLYRRVDREREEQMVAQPPSVEPYFPSGLSVEGAPLQFNFELFLFDSLRLPSGLFEEDGGDPVDFENLHECEAYCERFARDALREARDGRDEENTQATSSNPASLDKEAMFRTTGKGLESMLATGIESCDRNIARVRQDRFGNVMVWGAPAWSDLAPQFMHGYPRRLVSADHGGFLPGNVCVAARISNQFMRSMAPGDIAAFCYRQAMENLGLTRSELFLARQSAVAYSGQAKQPQRLLHCMVRYGIDFLTFSALGSEELVRLDELASALNRRRAENLSPEQYQQEGEEQSTSDTEGAVSEDSVELESSFLADRLSQSDREKLDADLPRLKTQLLQQFGGGASGASTPPQQPPDEGTSRPRARSSTPAAGSSGSSSTRRRRSRRKAVEGVATPEVVGSSQQAAATGEEDLGERLARVPGVSVAHLPGPSALASLREFFTKHVPVARAQVDGLESTSPTGQVPDSPSAIFGEVARGLHRTRRSREVNAALQALWDLASRVCVCTASDPGQPEDGVNPSPSEDCPYRTSQAMGEYIRPASEICHANCSVCEVFREYGKLQSCGITTNLDKNSRMQSMVTLGSLVVNLLWGGYLDTAQEQNKLKALMQKLLSCGKDKVNAVLSVGLLARDHTPRIAQVYLSSGWSEFWREMRRVGTALHHQGSKRACSAVLSFIRMKCVPPGNAWAYYLTSSDETSETQALESLLGHSVAEKTTASTSSSEAPSTTATSTTSTTAPSSSSHE